jgi:hypothetical protein
LIEKNTACDEVELGENFIEPLARRVPETGMFTPKYHNDSKSSHIQERWPNPR